MSTKLSNTDHYDATPAQTHGHAAATPSTPPAKYKDLGDVAFTVKNHEADDGGLNVTVDREVAANLPDLAKKVLGQTTKMEQTEVWRADGDGFVGNMIDVLVVAGGHHRHQHDQARRRDGADWTVNFDIKASVPLIGGKIEKMVAEETKSNLVKEFAFNQNWLANH